MGLVSDIASALGFWAAPRACALCGLPVDPTEGPDIPLCPDCEALLVPIGEPRCAACGRPLISEIGTCFACRGKRGACEAVRPLFPYKGKAGDLVRAYKEGRRRSLAAFWAGLVRSAAGEFGPGWTIVPVPPRPEKLAAGAWDQVEALASLLAAGGLAVARPLVRLGSSQQKRLSRRDRAANALKAYALSPKAPLPTPERVLLLDDVVTTGATLEACAAALLQGGSLRVAGIVLAAD